MEPRPGVTPPIPAPETDGPEVWLIPDDFERSTLQDLIEICRSRLPGELDIVVSDENPMSDIYAMIKTRSDYDIRLNSLRSPRPPGLSEAAKQHLIRMIVVHSEFISKESLGRSGSLSNGLKKRFVKEYEEFEAVRNDPDRLPEPWRLAYEDALRLRSSAERQE